MLALEWLFFLFPVRERKAAMPLKVPLNLAHFYAEGAGLTQLCPKHRGPCGICGPGDLTLEGKGFISWSLP